MKLSIVLFLVLVSGVKAQKAIKADTSFTINSAYQKEKKNYPQITIAHPEMPTGVQVARNCMYSSAGGRPLHADVFYPKKKNKAANAAVVLLHGGGWRSGNKSMAEPMAIALAAEGFVSVAVEYRLSTEAQYPAGIIDVRRAIKWLRSNAKKFGLDKDKIAVLGTSSGGQMAALMGTTNAPAGAEAGGNVQAAIDIDGILAFKHPESAEGKVAAEWLGGTYEEVPATWAEASALTHAGKHSVPILFINSSLPRFHAGRDDMIRKLDSANVYSEVHTLPDTPHPFWLFHPWFQPTVQRTARFLRKVFGT